jgi:hypothetical protein
MFLNDITIYEYSLTHNALYRVFQNVYKCSHDYNENGSNLLIYKIKYFPLTNVHILCTQALVSSQFVLTWTQTIHTRVSFTCEVFLTSYTVFSEYDIDIFNNYLFLARLLKDMFLYFFRKRIHKDEFIFSDSKVCGVILHGT